MCMQETVPYQQAILAPWHCLIHFLELQLGHPVPCRSHDPASYRLTGQVPQLHLRCPQKPRLGHPASRFVSTDNYKSMYPTPGVFL